MLVIPIVNAFGLLNHSRRLPDRRDLNRSSAGTERGSLAGRLANLFMTEIDERSDFGIDLHFAAIHRTNMPQIRVSPTSDQTFAFADAFGASVVIVSKLRDGSLRRAAKTRGVGISLLEGGEGVRFDELSARAGVASVLRVMTAKVTLPRKGIAKARNGPVRASSSSWQRAPAGGLLRANRGTGEFVCGGDLLGQISDLFGEKERDAICDATGIIVGRTDLPVVYEGDAFFHVAVAQGSEAEACAGALTQQLDGDPMFDEDEII